jgi:hypothetical protein
LPGDRVIKITHIRTLDFHPIFIPLNQPLAAILDFEFWIADLWYRFALSFFIKLIRKADLNYFRRRRINQTHSF